MRSGVTGSRNVWLARWPSRILLPGPVRRSRQLVLRLRQWLVRDLVRIYVLAWIMIRVVSRQRDLEVLKSRRELVQNLVFWLERQIRVKPRTPVKQRTGMVLQIYRLKWSLRQGTSSRIYKQQ